MSLILLSGVCFVSRSLSCLYFQCHTELIRQSCFFCAAELILTQSIVAKSSLSFQSMNETKDRANMLKPAEFHSFWVKSRKRVLRKQMSQICHFSPFNTNRHPSTSWLSRFSMYGFFFSSTMLWEYPSMTPLGFIELGLQRSGSESVDRSRHSSAFHLVRTSGMTWCHG